MSGRPSTDWAQATGYHADMPSDRDEQERMDDPLLMIERHESTQETPKGHSIPVPTREAVLGDLDRVARPKLRRGGHMPPEPPRPPRAPAPEECADDADG